MNNNANEAWQNFCDSLKEAGSVLLRDKLPLDELTQAEGLRYLTRMIRAGFENTHEFSDVMNPVLVPMVSPTMLYEGAGSSARYLHAFIDGRESYRIRGTRGTAPLIEIGLYNGKIGVQDPSHLVVSLTEEHLRVTDEGCVDVTIGPDVTGVNTLLSTNDTCYMMIRQYTHHWDKTLEGKFSIERIGDVKEKSPLSVAGLSRDLQNTAEFLQKASSFWAATSDYWAGFAVNQFVAQLSADAKTDVAPPSGHQFSCGYFRIEEDEALVVEFSPDDIPFWGFELANYWYEIIGFGDDQCRLNNKTVQYTDDGSVRLIISHRRPPGPNWLNVKGHREGTMIFRWSRSSRPVPNIKAMLCRLEELEVSE